MACPGTPCVSITAPAGWTFTANPVNPVFQDARLIGLKEADATGGTALVALDPVTGTLNRPAAPKGIWQHDPDHCGPDYVGNLDDPEFEPFDTADTAKALHIAMIQTDCDGTNVRLRKHTATSDSIGILSMLKAGACGSGVIPAKLAPKILSGTHEDSTGVVKNPRVLGYLTSGGEMEWFAWERWHQEVVPQVVEADTVTAESPAEPTLQFAFWRKKTGTSGGTTQELVGLPQSEIPRIVNSFGINYITRLTIYSQEHAPGGNVTSETDVFDVTGQSWYTDKIKGVIVYLSVVCDSISRGYNVYVSINGREYSSVNVLVGQAGQAGGHFFVPLPDTGDMTITVSEFVGTAGSAGTTRINAYIDGYHN